jgi:hypothetical protein
LDHSPIYIFFREKPSTVNRKNNYFDSNWILNIDKRLPLRLVIPGIIIAAKREEKAHKMKMLRIIILHLIALVKIWLYRI